MNVIKAKKPERIVKRKNNSAHSSGRKKSSYVMTNKQITDLIACPIRVSIHGYGVNNLYYVSGQKVNDFVNTTVNSLVNIDDTGGDTRSLGCLPGRQVYFEDCALKYSEDSNVRAVGNWSINIRDMMYKAYQDGRTFASHITTPTIGSFHNDAAKVYNKFIYHGGSVVHKFTNTTLTCCYMEFREFTPRQVYPSYTIVTAGGVTKYKNDGIYRTLFRDLAMRNPTSYASTFPNVSTDNGYDEFDDRQYKYDSKCLLTNARWVVGPSVMVKVMPGETYTYKMILHPFRYKDSDFQTILQSGAAGSMEGAAENAVYLPGFTKHLYMRAWGETNQWSQNNKWADGVTATNELLDPMPDNNFNTDEAPVQMLDRVTTSSVRLAHTRSEYHTFRTSNWNPNPNLHITRDFRDFGDTKYVPGTDEVVQDVNMEGDTITRDVTANVNLVADDVGDL